MISDKLADLTFGISSQSWAIAHLLSGWEPDFADYEKGYGYKFMVETFPFYNGRECAIAIALGKSMLSSTKLIITFGENRNSDNIFVDHWVVNDVGINPPTVKDYTDEAYRDRKFFRYDETYKAAQYIKDLMAEYYNKER